MRISVGMDVAKVLHWACAMDQAGGICLDRMVENTPEGIAAFVADLHALGGEPVIGLDVVGSFAHFLEATLLVEGFRLIHAPGIAVNRAGQGIAGGERKSDPRDARTIGTRDLRRVLPDDETVVALRLKVGRRRDLTAEQTRRLNRLRGLLGGLHQGLERDLDVTCKGPRALLTRYVIPAEIRQAGKRRTFGGDKALKRAFYQGASCAVCTNDPLSKAFYDRKRCEGKHHTQAPIARARRRVTMLWTMIQHRETFDPFRKTA